MRSSAIASRPCSISTRIGLLGSVHTARRAYLPLALPSSSESSKESTRREPDASAASRMLRSSAIGTLARTIPTSGSASSKDFRRLFITERCDTVVW